MKTIIAGGRNITDFESVLEAVKNSGFIISEVVSGAARGVDKLGEQYAKENNITLKKFYANWNKFGKRAGHLRNIEMGDYADALIAVWDGKSFGTKHMIDYATRKNLKVYIHIVQVG